MRAVLLTLLALAAAPGAPAVWLGKLDPGQVTLGLPQGTGRAAGAGQWTGRL